MILYSVNKTDIVVELIMSIFILTAQVLILKSKRQKNVTENQVLKAIRRHRFRLRFSRLFI